MSKLKVPSLQHLARIWRPEPELVCNELVKLSLNGPTFSYAPLHELVRDMLLLNVSFEQAVESLNRIPRHDVRENFLSLLPLIRAHFVNEKADFVHDVVPRLYAIDRELMIPFRPTMIYGSNGLLNLPWLSFWKRHPISGHSLSLFATITEEILRQDPELESASLQILDFSAPPKSDQRTLCISPLNDVPKLNHKEVVEMLSIFSEGFRLARIRLSALQTSDEKVKEQTVDSRQTILF